MVGVGDGGTGVSVADSSAVGTAVTVGGLSSLANVGSVLRDVTGEVSMVTNTGSVTVICVSRSGSLQADTVQSSNNPLIVNGNFI
jgi:hypothetical protein